MKRRLISATKSEIRSMSAQELKSSIRASEGRVVLEQNYVDLHPLLEGSTNAELAAAMGADLLFLNGYSMDPAHDSPGLHVTMWEDGTLVERRLRLKQMKELFPGPIGVYLECGVANDDSTSTNAAVRLIRTDRIASDENLRKLLDEEADFVVLGGNPGTSTDVERIIEATARAKQVLEDQVMIWSGKWEDGVAEKVIGDPSASFDSKEVVRRLIDAGADVICLPMPGSRTGITVDCIRELVTLAHTYSDDGALAMTFLDGSIEGSDAETVRACALMSKQTGADIHAIGDAGVCGMSVPEDIYQMVITLKGRRLGWLRMAAGRR